MAGSPALLVSYTTRGIATVTLDRPDRRNALGQQMMGELDRLLDEFARDDQVRVMVLRGAGRHFCAGADVSEHGTTSEARIALPDLLAKLDTLPKSTIAVVQGGAVGGGMALAACCDVILAVDTAFFSIPELRLGLVPTALLPFFSRLIGDRAFRRYGFTGERIAGQEVVRLGIADALLREDDVQPQLDKVTDALLHAAPAAVRQLKLRLAAQDWPERAAELAEGIASFREKRKPAWYKP